MEKLLRGAFGGVVLAVSVVSAYSADKYFRVGSGTYLSGTSWYADEQRTEQSSVPNYEDTAIFQSTNNGTAWVTQIDTYLGNLIASKGMSNINLGRELINSEVPANFQIYGKLSVQLSDEYTNFGFRTSFDDAEGTVGVELRVGSIDIGTEVYGGGSYDKYGQAQLTLDYRDARLSSSKVFVDGDVKMGGGLAGVSAAALMYVGADLLEVGGTVTFSRNGVGYNNIHFLKSCTFETGGLISTNTTSGNTDFLIANDFNTEFVSSVVLKNAAGTDYQFIGLISDDGNGRTDITAIKAVTNVVMEGEGTQRIYSTIKGGVGLTARQSGTYSVKSGKLIFDNSSIAADYRLAVLSLEGGKFGAAHYDSAQAGIAYFKSAELISGGLAYENFKEHNSIVTGVSDKIVVSDTLKKTGAGKIAVDFSDRSGNSLDLSDFVLAEDAQSIEMWVEILAAGDIEGFDMSDANSDFYGEGLKNGIAVFRWIESSGGGYGLEVGFAQVPEGATTAVAMALAAFSLAFLRRRK